MSREPAKREAELDAMRARPSGHAGSQGEAASEKAVALEESAQDTLGKHGKPDSNPVGGKLDNAQHVKAKRHGAGCVVLVIAAIVAAIAVIAALVTAYLINTGRANLLGDDDIDLAAAESAEVGHDGKTVTYNGRQYRQKDGVVSICLIGNDKDARDPQEGFNGQADAVMVLALDTSTGNMQCIAVPRNSMVEVNRNYWGTDEFADTKLYQLCLAYGYGTDDEESSELVCTAVSRILYNVPMNYYYTISLSGIAALADVVGGVTVEALQDIPDTYIYEGETVTLEGYEAQRYVQWRDKYQDGSAQDRQARQQQFVKALGAQILETVKGDPGAVVSIANSLSDYSTTNLGASELAFLASVVANTGVSSVEMSSLQGEVVNNDESEWEQFILDKDAVYQTVLDVYYEEVDDGSAASGEAAGAGDDAASASASAGPVSTEAASTSAAAAQ